MSGRTALVLGIGLALCVACGGASEGSQQANLPHAPRPSKRPKAARLAGPLTAHRLAEVSDVIGPYVGRDGDVALAAWAEPSARGRALLAAAIDAKGVPSAPSRIGQLAGELDLVLVRGFGAASAGTAGQPRFAVITTRRGEQLSHIDVTAVAASGAGAWGPLTLAERSARVLWVGFVVSAGKPLLLWAEQPHGAKGGEPASLYALPISADAKPAQPQLVATKSCAWQTASVGAQAALATVRSAGASCTTGPVALELLGSTGKVEKTVELGGRAALDLDLVGDGSSFVVAWSDHQQLEPRINTALVDAQGAVRAPAAAAVPALGEQAVVALVPGASPATPAFLVWENLAERPEWVRALEVSALDASGRASGVRSRLLFGRVDGGAPELQPFAGGVAALTLAPACGLEEACESSLPVPTYVALDASLKVRTSEPLVLDALGGRAADLGWGLTCPKAGCFALAAPSGSPARLFSVPLPVRENHYRAAAEEAAPSAKPRVVGSDVLVQRDDPLAHITLSALAGRELLGYVTDFDPTTPWQKLSKPAEDGRLEPLRARIAVRAYAGDGARAALAEEQPVSLRAHSLGGLTLLPDVAPGSGALAVWTGLDKGEPQVFLTALGADGKRLQQRMLTRKTGDASDVAGLTVEGGYLVAWVDERNRDAEVYAARVSRTLEKASPEQRITNAEGAAADLVVTRVAGKPYVVWTDSRDAEQPGWADIYGAFLRPSDATREGQEHRLSSTRPHSFAPRLSSLGGAPVLAWLEEEADGAPAGVRLALLSDAGDIAGPVQAVPVHEGAPRALGLDCGSGACRVVVGLENEGRAELHGCEWKPNVSTSRLTRLTGLGGPAAAAVAPVVRGNVVYAADVREGHGLLRRLTLEW